jgi:integrase
MAVNRARLTDALVRDLKAATGGAPYRVADADQPGLFVVVGRRTKAFAAQADRRANGRRACTIKRVLGHALDMPVRAARAAAREFLGRIARGEDPSAPKQQVAGFTLGQIWTLYEAEHLRRLGRSDRTIANYRFHVEGHLSEWIDIPLAELGRDPRRVADMHARITQTAGPAQANAVMRTFGALYNFARRQAPGQMPPECPTKAVTFHPARRRNTAMGLDDLPGWWKQLQAIKNPIRVEFHLLTLLSGCRPGALKIARWRDVDVKRRVLHIPRPKGGIERAFDIPLSRAMLRSLWRVRRAGRLTYPATGQEWIFPTESCSGHLVEHKEDRKILSHWGGDLRQSYRTIAQAIGISEVDVQLLMNHALPGVSAGYLTRAKLVPTSLRDAQEKLSRLMLQKVALGRPYKEVSIAKIPKE